MATEPEIRQALNETIASIAEDPPDPQAGDDIFEDFGLDSLDQVELLYQIEEKFGVKIEDETFEEDGLRRFGRLVAYLADRVDGNVAAAG